MTGVTGPTALHHSNFWPGRSTVPSMILAGIQMFAPKKLWSLTGNHVFQVPRICMTGAALDACSVVSFGATGASCTLTFAPLTQPARASTTLAIAAVIAAGSSL